MSNEEKTINPIEIAESRNKIIISTSLIGIAANLFLVGFKAFVGLLSNSIAVILDAVNNLSDALSSVITIIGTRIANKKPDKKHPLGHGRVEYISAMLVSALVLYAGITAMVESVKKIINPVEANYSKTSLIIIASAVVVKFLLSRYVVAQGNKANSQSLVASGKDAGFDAIVSLSVLLSAVIYLIWGVSLEAYVGVLISVLIIKAGFEMLFETFSDILGRRADPELVAKIREIISAEPEVRGVYDIILNNYGPERNYASLHIELPDYLTVDKVDVLTRRVQAKVYMETGVILTGVGVYSFNTGNDNAAQMRNTVLEKVLAHDWALQLHGFYVDEEKKEMRFDVVMSFDVDHDEGLKILHDEISALYPDYSLSIVPDVDISDLE
jgi:cation diffusion facilitator family transporter